MLKQIEIANFRVFGDPVMLRLRPITVLVGRNSAGKSTLLKFLLMLQQSLDTTEDDFLSSDGSRVKLGDFPSLKNSHNKQPSLRFKLQYETSDLPDAREMALYFAAKAMKRRTDPLTNETQLRITIPGTSDHDFSKSAHVVVDGRVSYGSRGQDGTHRAQVFLGQEKVLDELGPLRNREVRLLRFPARSSEPHTAIVRVFSDRFLSSIRHELSSMQHLAAVREESSRVIVASSPPSGSVGQRGQFAMPHLQKVLTETGAEASFVQHHLAGIADVQDIRFQFAGRGYVAHAKAVNRMTGAESYLADFGFGVGQCLPVVVQGAISSPGTLLMVEQPEAQLHPTAQLEMGSFFAELWSERKVTSLIETHSSQIVLRLRRLIAKGSLSPTDVSLAYIHVSDDGMPAIKNLDINDAGNLEKGLPMEFFGADVLESMQMGLRK